MILSRRAALALGSSLLLPLSTRAASASVELVNDLEKRFDYGFKAGLLDGLHGVIVWHQGNVVAERYYAGVDWSWGQNLGH